MKKQPAIEYLRVLAMLYIVCYWHLFNYVSNFEDYDGAVPLTVTKIFLGLFIFISGYLNGTKRARNSGIGVFFKKKILRLYPLFAIALAIFHIAGQLTTATLIKSLSFLSLFSGPLPPTLWFIAVLFLYFAVTPLLWQAGTSMWRFVLAGVLMLVVLILLFDAEILSDLRTVQYFPCYAIGIFFGSKEWNDKAFYGSISGAAILILGVGLMQLNVSRAESVAGLLQPVPVLIGGVLLIFFTFKMLEAKLPHSRVIQFLGFSSYCMYLFHRPVYSVFKLLILPDERTYQLFYLYLFAVPLVTLLSYLCQRLYNLALDAILKK